MKKGECGSVFVLVIALCALCMVAAVGVAHVGYAIQSKTRAQNAADAGALAGAYAIAHGSNNGCGDADVAARRNMAHIVSCRSTTDDIIVTVALNADNTYTAVSRTEIE